MHLLVRRPWSTAATSLNSTSLRSGCVPKATPLIFQYTRDFRRSLVTGERPKLLKRFYKKAYAEQVNHEAWCINLDSKTFKTPKGTAFHLPSHQLALSIAEEWERQETHIDSNDMPLTTLACTAIDLVRNDPAACIERLLPYLSCDTVCFKDVENERLAELQDIEWEPLRGWFQMAFGVKLDVATGVGVPEHPDGTIEAVTLRLALKDEWELCSLEVATATAKSLVIATALLERPDTTPEDARRWALLEEISQIERWGLVEGEHDTSHAECLRWLSAIQKLSREVRGSSH